MYFFCSAACGSRSRFSFLRSDGSVVIPVGGGLVFLYGAQGGIALSVRSSELALCGKTHTDEEIIIRQHAGSPLEIVGSLCIQNIRPYLLISADQIVDGLRASPEFISHRHHHEGGMACVLSQDIEAFLPQEFLRLFYFGVFLFITRMPCSPERYLGLEVDAQQIRGNKCRLRGCAGVASLMIDAPVFGDLKVLEPPCHIHGCKAGKRKEHTLMSSAKESLPSVYRKMILFGSELSEPEP